MTAFSFAPPVAVGPRPESPAAGWWRDRAGGAELAQLRADFRQRPALLVLTGEFDLASTGMLGAALDQLRLQAPPEVDVDISGVTFIDCAGLRPLLTYQREAAGGGQLRLRGSSPAVDRLLRALGRTAAGEPSPAAA